MQKLTLFTLLVFSTLIVFTSCEKEDYKADGVSQEIIEKVTHLGFNPDGIVAIEEGYLVERDIVITHELLEGHHHTDHFVPEMEQYRTTNVVNTGGGRIIKLWVPGSFNNDYRRAIRIAAQAYNNLGLDISFRAASSELDADIVFTRLSFFEELIGVLGSAGFPDAQGNPYPEIKLNGSLSGQISTGGIATIVAHEMGHCIGFRHTDYYDRSISCGGTPDNEGDGGVGAILIPGTPFGADLGAPNGSWMLSCTDGSPRPFTTDDITALNWMYKGNF